MADKPKALVNFKVMLDTGIQIIVTGHHLELTNVGHLVIFNDGVRTIRTDRHEKLVQAVYAAGTWRSVARVSEEGE